MSKIVVTNFYPVHPVEHGGQRRIYFLSRELSCDHHVTMVTLVRGRPMRYLQISPRFVEVQVPAEQEYIDFERSLHKDVPMTADVAYAMKWSSCRLYQGVLQQHVRDCDLAISEHPYSVPAMLKAMPSKRTIPLIYNSQNVESRQKAPVLLGRDDLIKVVEQVEDTAVRQSVSIVACTEVDKGHFIADYGASPDKVAIVENGVDAKSVPEISSDQVKEFRKYLGIEDKFVAIFGGSHHFPNLAAADAILEFAHALPDMVFVILGSICRYEVLSKPVPPNVLALGTVSEEEKWLCFSVANIALNPMTHGSGSNIKMFEYAAAGLPTLSTNFGARATGLQPEQHYIEAALQDFPTRLSQLAHAETQELLKIGRAARSFVVERADWSVIGERYRKLVASVLEDSDAI